MNIRSLVVLAAGAVFGFSLAVGSAVLAGRSEGEAVTPLLPREEARLLAEVLERVKQEYVEPVSEHDLMEAAVRGMVTELDPHSQYLDADQFEEIRISSSGNYSGVGLEVNLRNGRVTVVSPLAGAPAAEAGIRAGDVITHVDGVEVDNGSVSDTIARLRGKVGTRVQVTVDRAGEPGPLEFTLTRDHVRVQSVRSEALDVRHAYVRISQFSDTTAAELDAALRQLDQPRGRLEGLVLDLRDNPGGVLEAAVEVADLFLERGVIVTAVGRSREATFRHDARAGDVLAGAPIVVLVNRGSASAAEIVAGALRDHARATIAGSRTYGKGSVQTVMPLSEGRAIKITTSRYFTPSGESIQGRGISPDVEFEGPEATASLTSGAADRSAARDPEVRRALELLTGARPLQTRLAPSAAGA